MLGRAWKALTLSSVCCCYEITLDSRRDSTLFSSESFFFFSLVFFSFFFNYLIYSLHTFFSFSVQFFFFLLFLIYLFRFWWFYDVSGWIFGAWEKNCWSLFFYILILSFSYRRCRTRIGVILSSTLSSVYFLLIRHTLLLDRYWRWENNDTHEDDVHIQMSLNLNFFLHVHGDLS